MNQLRSLQLLSFVAVAASTAAAGQGFDFNTRVSLASIEAKGACTAFPDSNLSSGTPLAFVSVPVPGAKQSPTLLSGTLQRRLAGEDCSPDVGCYGCSFYRVAIAAPAGLEGPLFVIIAPPRLLRIRGRAVVGDLDGDGRAEEFRICTSMEGLHLTIWSGDPLKGKLRFHRYFPLHYDVEPTCTEADYAEP